MIVYAIRSDVGSLRMWLVDPIGGRPGSPPAGKWTTDRRHAVLYPSREVAEKLITEYQYTKAMVEERLVAPEKYPSCFISEEKPERER